SPTAMTTLSLHDALPISVVERRAHRELLLREFASLLFGRREAVAGSNALGCSRGTINIGMGITGKAQHRAVANRRWRCLSFIMRSEERRVGKEWSLVWRA